MKKLYLLHLLSLLILLFLGGYFVYELMSRFNTRMVEERSMYYSRSIFLLRTYGVFSLLFFLFSVFIGWKAAVIFPKIRLLHILGGFGFCMWSILMMKSSHQMSFHFEEVFLGLLAYGVFILLTNVYILLNYDKIRSEKINYKDEILDEGME